MLVSILLLLTGVIIVVLAVVLTPKSDDKLSQEKSIEIVISEPITVTPSITNKDCDIVAQKIMNFSFPGLLRVSRPYYKAVVLIIAGSAKGEYVELYKNFEMILEKYATLHPNFLVVYLKCELNDTAPFIRWDTSNTIPSVILNMEESFQPGIIYKTLAGMKTVTDHVNYDYLIRSNLSSFLNWSEFDKFLDTLSLTDVYAGHLNGRLTTGFCSGPFTLSKDVANYILEYVQNRSGEINWLETPDDVIVGEIVNLKIGEQNRIHIPGGWFTEYTEITLRLIDKLKSESSKVWFRVRNPDINRTEIDTFIHKYLLKECYGIDI